MKLEKYKNKDEKMYNKLNLPITVVAHYRLVYEKSDRFL